MVKQRRTAKASRSTGARAARAGGADKRFCFVPAAARIVLPDGIDPRRASAIVLLKNKWVNETLLQFYFMDEWPAAAAQKKAVRDAFAHWKGLGIGLNFEETTIQEDAEIRVGFDQTDGSWSYVGTDNLTIASQERTMNFGWDLTSEWGGATALHEIGHALGMPHEHQNPNAGIVWDEERVYEVFMQSQGWSREMIFNNVIRKIPVSDVKGTKWDPTSIMHYPFEAGLIKAPAGYTSGTPRNVKLSEMDIGFMRGLYPQTSSAPMQLRSMQLQSLRLAPGQQADFIIEPEMTRYHKIETVGQSDSKMVLFEERDGKQRYVTADDDSGTDLNARIRHRLTRDRRYFLRVRLHHVSGPEGFGVYMV